MAPAPLEALSSLGRSPEAPALWLTPDQPLGLSILNKHQEILAWVVQ